MYSVCIQAWMAMHLAVGWCHLELKDFSDFSAGSKFLAFKKLI